MATHKSWSLSGIHVDRDTWMHGIVYGEIIDNKLITIRSWPPFCDGEPLVIEPAGPITHLGNLDCDYSYMLSQEVFGRVESFQVHGPRLERLASKIGLKLPS